MEKITVLESVQGKFGPQLKDEKGYLSFGKFYKGPTAFDNGTEVNVDLFVTGKGTRYINSLELLSSKSTPTTVVMPKTSRKSKSTVVPETKIRDYDKENRGKVKSLFIEALLSNPNITDSVEALKLLNTEELQESLDKLVESVF